MSVKYGHGGGYKQAALLEGLSVHEVVDYSTSVNWLASSFHPNGLEYFHCNSIEYPDITYNDLKYNIETYHGISNQHFTVTNGANEAISVLFHTFNLMKFNENKSVVLVGPTYCEYHKYAELNKFNVIKMSFEEFSSKLPETSDKIVVIVNPNTPIGEYFDIRLKVEQVLNVGGIVVVDESFIDFTEKESLYPLVKNNQNLFIIYSFTKFYGAAGARLGIITNNNISMREYISFLVPPWCISAYDNWLYNKIIPKFAEIKTSTIEWVSKTRTMLKKSLSNSKNISIVGNSVTNYCTLELSQKFLEDNNITDFKRYFLRKYKVYVRPAGDFHGCSRNSFRVGFRLWDENELIWKMIKDI